MAIAFHINGNRLPFQFSDADANTYNKEKKMSIALFKGDILTITGRDIGAFAGMLATIQFFDLDGKETIFNSDKGWYCNGKPAIEVLLNDKYKTFPAGAKWIWADAKTRQKTDVRCSFLIPCN